MGELVVAHAIPPSSGAAIAKIRELEALALEQPQIDLMTEHVLHGGMYARTLRVPAGVLVFGALVKIPTMLAIEGDCLVYLDDDTTARIAGSQVLPASGGRKQAFLAIADTRITMVFPTVARTVGEAEDEFTDEADRLQSRSSDRNSGIITGE